MRSIARTVTITMLLALTAWAVAQDGSDALVAKCKADAAQLAGVAVADIETKLVEQVTWRDGSLGCPKPGMDYTMALVPGYKIVLDAGGRTMEYHTDLRQRVVLCEDTPADDAGGGDAPAPTGARVLVLEPVADAPNLNGRLVSKALDGGDDAVILPQCSAFSVSDSGLILAKRRTSRSTHELVVVDGAETEVVATAFDFECLTFLEPTSSFVYFMRARAGDDYSLFAADRGAGPQPLAWAPTARQGQGASASVSGAIIVLNLPAENAGAGRVIALSLVSQTVLLDIEAPIGAAAPN